MVTGSKKTEVAVPNKMAEAKSEAIVSKTASKPKTAAAKKPAAKATSKPKTTTAKKPAAKATSKPKTTTAKKPAAKATSKPKTTTKPKNTGAVKAPQTARKVGEMFYNDELLESIAELVLRGSDSDLGSILPEIKKQLFDYDIYMVSFLNDGEVGAIAANVAGLQKVAAKDLTDRLLAVRESAKVFVGIAGKHNSVRAYIDRAIEAEGRETGINRIKAAFLTGEYCIRDVDSATCESFLTLF